MESSECPASFDPGSLTDQPLSGDLPTEMNTEDGPVGSQTASPQQTQHQGSPVPDCDQPKDASVESEPDPPGEASNSTELAEEPTPLPSVPTVPDEQSVSDIPEKNTDNVALDETGESATASTLTASSDAETQSGSSTKLSPVSNAYLRGASMYRKTLKPKKERSPSPEIQSPESKNQFCYRFPKTEPPSPPPEENVAQEPSGARADSPQPSLTSERKMRLRTLRPKHSIMGNKVFPKAEGKNTQTDTIPLLGFGQLKTERVDNGDPSPSVEPSMGESGGQTSSGEGAADNLKKPAKEEVVEPMVRTRRAEAIKAETINSTIHSSESMNISDEDSDAMVDDPKDEDFVPFRSKRPPTRMSMRSQMAHHHTPPQQQPQPPQQQPQHKPQPPQQRNPRAGSAPLTKMTCANCRTPLQKGQTAYQRKGLPQLFCSSACLTAYSRKPLAKKTCTFCKKEILSSKDSVVAQTGPGGSFQEFCTSACLSLFEAQPQRPAVKQPAADTGDIIKCSICHKPGEIQHEVSNGNVVHRLCSDSCFTKFRATKGLKTNCCDNCGIYIYNKGLPLEYLFHEGQQKRFCNSTCLNGYKKKNTKVYPCMWCKTLCKNFEMLSNVDKNNRMGLFCSVCCITSHKVKQSGMTAGPTTRPCSLCRRSLSEPVYYNKTERVVYQFCSPSCWTKFQRTTPEGGIHLSCHYCNNLFTGKPEILEWQNNVYQFCCKDCCADYKRLRGVVSQCEYCKQEKLLHEKIRFSGVEKNFCSEGCVLLYKQDFTKNLGLCCITCTYCSQTCQRAVTEELDGSTWDFCSEDCKSKYLLWYFKAARCHACKRQGKLLETIHWRGEIKHFCNQQCLLRFYNQQNQPNLDTQKGPESLLNSKKSQGPDAKTQAAATPSKPESNTTMKTRSAQLPTTPPPTPVTPTPRKNKAAMCKPLMQNRGVSCKVETRCKHCQTEEDWRPQVIIVPVPVPIFVPVPMHMYCQNVPVPVAVPIPVPVPMFLPTTLDSADKIVETIEELKVKIPSNPLEADILAMAEIIAQAEELDKASSDLCDLASDQSAEGLLEDCDLFGPARDDVLAMAVKMANVLEEPGQDLEADFPKNALDMNPNVDFLFDCGLGCPDDVSADQEIPRAQRKGQKRLALSESCSRDSMSSQPSCKGLDHSYGVNAWRSWVQAKYANGEPSKVEDLRFGPKPIRIKDDILACTAAELNYGLAHFVKEVTRPNGERYEPDSIYYLLLGIQQYLLDNSRMVNIFTDQYYLTFVQELNKVLYGWHTTAPTHSLLFSRVEEEHLWDCKQLGVYSPFVLLNTLMFFNTKFFGLRTAEEHMQLSFTNVVRQTRKYSTSRGTIKMLGIRYYPPARQRKGRESSSTKRKREDDSPVLEQRENRMNPLRCPVKFYEFYLSKCPDSMKNRNDVFYLQPERSCVAESPLWYSVIPMDKGMLDSMLNRILAVREIYEEHSRVGGLEDDMD